MGRKFLFGLGYENIIIYFKLFSYELRRATSRLSPIASLYPALPRFAALGCGLFESSIKCYSMVKLSLEVIIMKKFIILLSLILALSATLSPASYAADAGVTIPTFNVALNGVSFESTSAKYPLVVYKGITYFPMTWNLSRSLGLTLKYSATSGLEIQKAASLETVKQDTAGSNRLNSTYTAKIVTYPVIVGGQRIDNAREAYPILNFRDITYFPLTWRFAKELFGWDYQYSQAGGLVIGSGGGAAQVPVPAPVASVTANGLSFTEKTMKVGSRSIPVSVVTVDLKSGKLKARAVLAGTRVGETNTLEAAAKREKAIFAINGTFFDAYNGYGTPSNTLVVDGKLVTTGGHYGTLGISGSEARIDRVSATVNGENTGGVFDKVSWYNGGWQGFSLNTPLIHANDQRIVIFDRQYQSQITLNPAFTGTVFNVSGSVISKAKPWTGTLANTGDYTVVFPSAYSYPGKDTNLLAATGALINQNAGYVYTSYAKFAEGSRFGMHSALTAELGGDFWAKAESVVGAGPLLVRDGVKSIDLAKEAFYEAKITTNSAARSAVGISADGRLIFLTTTATLHELADIMIQLGAKTATNLDGGASSGMYYNGKMIRTPGRAISNAIVIEAVN